MTSRALAVSAAICALLAGACNGRQAGSPAVSSQAVTPDGRPLQAVVLPDLSQMAESAQKQIRDGYAALGRVQANHSASAGEMSLAYGEMGKLLMAAQYPDPAEACFLNAQMLDSTDFRWPYYLGQLYRTKGEIDKSRALFERTLQLRPDDVSTMVWLGNMYLSSGLPEAAEPQFAKALSLEPRSLSARYGLGRAALARNDPKRAVTYLEEILKQDPTATGAHYPLSQAYTALGDSAKAGEHLRQRRNRDIVPADPLMDAVNELLESPQNYETLGIRALDRQDMETAAAYFRKGLALMPDSPSLRFRLATVMNLTGDAEHADALFAEVVRDAPEYFPAQFSLGVVLQSKGQHREAIEHFTAALGQRADYAEARLRLASSLVRLGRAPEALTNYEQVAKANPDLVEAQVGYAMTLARLGRYREARDRFAQANTSRPDEPVFAQLLARLLAAAPDDSVRDGARAMNLIQQVVARRKTIDAGETLAMALAEVGEYDRAAGVQRDLLAAAGKAGLPAVAQRLARNLALYEKRQPCRTPWADEEMP